MIRRIVLLGTGTGVGKTYFGVRLAESLLLAGRSVLALKPIESGVSPSTTEATEPWPFGGLSLPSEVGHDHPTRPHHDIPTKPHHDIPTRAHTNQAHEDDPFAPEPGAPAGTRPSDADSTQTEATDAERLARASRLSDDAQQRLALASARVASHCYALPEPISPHLAARRAGVSIELPRVTSWVRQNEETLRDTTLHYTLIESAGGVFSPLAPTLTNFDLAQSLEPATWILVAPDSLGVLHDVRATLLAMSALGRRPDHVVLCGARPPDASTGTNRAELEGLGIATIAAELGRDAPASAELCAFLG